jgi:hypothetical protein
MRKAVPISLLLIILLSSCTVTEQISLKNSNYGTIESSIAVEDFFLTVLDDFSEFMPSGNESILDGGIREFASGIGKSRNTTAVTLDKPTDNSYLVSLECNNITALLNELSGGTQTILKTGANSLDFKINLDNYPELKAIVPFLADPNFEVFLPEYNVGYTEEDYLEMIVFLLGDEAPEKIRQSTVKVQLLLPGQVTNTVNCRKTGTNTIEYEFRLIDFLLLAEPLSFSVSWK